MENCPFCQIIAHEKPATLLYEDEQVIAIPDLHPLAATHILVISKVHIASLNDFTPDQSSLLGELLLTARKIAFAQGIGESGYRIVINTNAGGGQTVFHLHIHLLAGAPFSAGLITRGLQ
jgi:histidine triad (HIT) family protein